MRMAVSAAAAAAAPALEMEALAGLAGLDGRGSDASPRVAAAKPTRFGCCYYFISTKGQGAVPALGFGCGELINDD